MQLLLAAIERSPECRSIGVVIRKRSYSVTANAWRLMDRRTSIRWILDVSVWPCITRGMSNGPSHTSTRDNTHGQVNQKHSEMEKRCLNRHVISKIGSFTAAIEKVLKLVTVSHTTAGFK